MEATRHSLIWIFKVLKIAYGWNWTFMTKLVDSLVYILCTALAFTVFLICWHYSSKILVYYAPILWHKVCIVTSTVIYHIVTPLFAFVFSETDRFDFEKLNAPIDPERESWRDAIFSFIIVLVPLNAL